MMSAPMIRCVSTTFSGVKRCFDPSIWERNCTPSSDEFAYARERKYLKASAIGQYGFFPSVELVQSTGPFENIEPRTQVEMVGVAQYDLSLYVVAQLVLVYRFDTAHSPYGHEYGGLYRSVIGGDKAGTGVALRVGML